MGYGIDKGFLAESFTKKGNGTIEETCWNSLQSSTTDMKLAVSIDLWSCLLTTKICQAKLVK